MTESELTAAERLADELDRLPTTFPHRVGAGVATIRALVAAYHAQQVVVTYSVKVREAQERYWTEESQTAQIKLGAAFRHWEDATDAYRAQQKETP